MADVEIEVDYATEITAFLEDDINFNIEMDLLIEKVGIAEEEIQIFCEFCSKPFKTLNGLTRHKKNKHIASVDNTE